ncbi:outer membrane protein assembly factor BamC [Marinospirillum sp.]|uniref:outer membrane protein assembly factor BamC n=1 Tax=Marinospirillum sp. TaxID=2183934 RepID=UPI0028703EAA|nr:outer membrane protein assembly factor BamC [Marinospirillum sp.]MDR9467027.1 outer membrane protein assembly factor BamC [Marinospirillum sp.]
MKFMQTYALVALLTVLVISGCSNSAYRDRSDDYPKAREVEHELPDDYRHRDAMPIPETQRTGQARDGEVPRPEPLRVAASDTPLVEQRTDEEAAWLLVQRSPAEVWPALQAFAEQQDMPVTGSYPRRGEITWQEDAASGLAAQKITLRQGVRRGTAEVRLRSFEENTERLAFSDYDRTRLMALKQFLLATLEEGDQRVSQQAQSLHSREQVRLVDRDDRQVLVFRLEFERAWSELTRLLEDEFDEKVQELKDVDRSEGRIYLRYVPQDERRQGFFARLFGRGPSEDAHHYQLHLVEYNNELDLTLQSEPGEPAPEEIERELLSWLERQLR